MMRLRTALWLSLPFGCRFFIQMIQYLLNHDWIFNTGDQLHPAPALLAGLNINIEYTL